MTRGKLAIEIFIGHRLAGRIAYDEALYHVVLVEFHVSDAFLEKLL